MKNTEDITADFGTLYHPKSALVFYEASDRNAEPYVEYFDMDESGSPINAHPLTVREADMLAKSLKTEGQREQAFLNPAGILPTNVLQIRPGAKGQALWYTKACQRQLYFSESLGIPSGKAHIPPLLWMASQNSLSVFALAIKRRPTKATPIYHAPFFNVYQKGNVCMGTVRVDIKRSASLETFIQSWEHYFFNSYFSHLMDGHNPIKGNCVSLWKDLVNTGSPFPAEVLKETKLTLQQLLS